MFQGLTGALTWLPSVGSGVVLQRQGCGKIPYYYSIWAFVRVGLVRLLRLDWLKAHIV